MTQASYKQALALVSLIILSILSFQTKIVMASTTVHPAAHIHRGLSKGVLECTVYELDALTMAGEKSKIQDSLSCASDFHGPTVFLKGNSNEFFSNKLVSGVTSLTIPTHLVSAYLQVDLNDPRASELIVVSHGYQKRGLRGLTEKEPYRVEFEGTFGILVVRVSDNRNHSPTHSAEEISRHIFSDDLTMTSQYQACSNDKLQLIPADGSDVVNGVLDIIVDTDLSRPSTSNECMVAADNVIDSSSFDLGSHKFAMYICPGVTEDSFGSALAVADVRGPKSWYLDTYGSMPFVLMHEFGHNLGFYHSKLGIDEYGDPTGIMGNKFELDRKWGKMCFNAAKTYNAGWYSDHHAYVSPQLSPYNGNIVDVNAAVLGNIKDRDDVVVQVQTPNNVNNLYFMLNRLEGITSDMLPQAHDTHANRVNIVSQSYPQGVPSDLLASLRSGEEYIQDDWAGTGKALRIKVCSIAATSASGGARVITYIEGETSTSCEVDNHAPTSALTPSSSPAPTCVDSTLKMFIRDGAKKGCAWVAANNTEQRCMIPGVASHCPATCGTCMLCVDSGKRFQMKNEGKDIKSCSWVRRTDTVSRCEKEGVTSACRATCGTCKA